MLCTNHIGLSMLSRAAPALLTSPPPPRAERAAGSGADAAPPGAARDGTSAGPAARYHKRVYPGQDHHPHPDKERGGEPGHDVPGGRPVIRPVVGGGGRPG